MVNTPMRRTFISRLVRKPAGDFVVDSVSYEFGADKGIIMYTYPDKRQPDTKVDRIALGFQTLQKDAVLVRINSRTSDDYIEMELV